MINYKGVLRALEERDEETGKVERNGVEQHNAAEPFIDSRWEDTFIKVSIE